MSEIGKRDYKNGKIYCIRNSVDDDLYVGSSCQALSKRWQKHKDSLTTYKKDRKLYSKMNELGVDNFYIELIEEYPCDNVEQLRRREGEIIREWKPILNKQIAGRTINEWREDNKEHIQEDKKNYYIQNKEKLNEYYKEWYEENKEEQKQKRKEYKENNREKVLQQKREYHHKHKDRINEDKKQYYQDNKEYFLEKAKRYQEENREKCKEKSKAYHEANKEKISEKRNVKIECECGMTYTHCNKARHLKSKTHQNNLNNNIDNVQVSQEEQENRKQSTSSEVIA